MRKCEKIIFMGFAMFFMLSAYMLFIGRVTESIILTSILFLALNVLGVWRYQKGYFVLLALFWTAMWMFSFSIGYGIKMLFSWEYLDSIIPYGLSFIPGLTGTLAYVWLIYYILKNHIAKNVPAVNPVAFGVYEFLGELGDIILSPGWYLPIPVFERILIRNNEARHFERQISAISKVDDSNKRTPAEIVIGIRYIVNTDSFTKHNESLYGDMLPFKRFIQNGEDNQSRLFNSHKILASMPRDKLVGIELFLDDMFRRVTIASVANESWDDIYKDPKIIAVAILDMLVEKEQLKKMKSLGIIDIDEFTKNNLYKIRLTPVPILALGIKLQDIWVQEPKLPQVVEEELHKGLTESVQRNYETYDQGTVSLLAQEIYEKSNKEISIGDAYRLVMMNRSKEPFAHAMLGKKDLINELIGSFLAAKKAT